MGDMRSKKVWRYWCDFCSKGGCSKSAMVKHEQHCTLNPARKCRMCTDFPRVIQQPIADLIAAYNEGIEALRTKANGCPACMLAAIRQWKRDNDLFPDERWDYWDFSAEREVYWRTHGTAIPEVERW